MSLSENGMSVARYGADPNRARVIYASDDGRNWARYLPPGQQPGMGSVFPVAVARGVNATRAALPSPLDNWVFYMSSDPMADPVTVWGQEPGSAGAREYFSETSELVMRLFAPGVAEVSSVY